MTAPRQERGGDTGEHRRPDEATGETRLPRDADPTLFFNRELSWLEFNARVLHEARDPRTPLLERLKFLGIFSSNLDEFYQVRVGGLRRKVHGGQAGYPQEALQPPELLHAIERRVGDLLALQRACLAQEILPALAQHGVHLVRMNDLSPSEWLAVDEYFEREVFPVLTPLAVDPGHPFPYISNLSLSLAVRILDPKSGEEHFARVKVPKSLPRWVPAGRVRHFVPIEEVIGANLGALFPGMEIVGWHAFRITRYSDLDLTGVDEDDDLLTAVERQVFERKFGEVVRLEVQHGMPDNVRALLLEELREEDGAALLSLPLSERDIDETGPLLDLGDLLALAGAIDLPELRDPPYTPRIPDELHDHGIFEAIRQRDILVHHPFESFRESVERFLEVAAVDEHVLALKVTLYRTSGETAIVKALIEAAQRGKQVVVLIELQARFDEANNITWARTLENYGVHVVYGVPGLKTHTKTVLVVRRDPDGIRRYIHIGTGNYNSRTARLYTDVGLFTCSPSIGADVSDLFNALTGFSRQKLYRKLLVAPANMRARFVEMIDREAAHARAGRGGRIVAKMNALVDPETILALYRASQAGVEIDLIVRGVCCLRPGLPGTSERIRVRSIIGRFLEHSRLFYFGNAGAGEYWFGSADWMPRNFDRRVETVVPVDDPALHPRLASLLELCLADNRQAWLLSGDGTWRQELPPPDGAVIATHVELLADPWGRHAVAVPRGGLVSRPSE
ncbi:MAG: polyphosphate kinase 1 [Gemmatimonadaceae bacterium]|jgi:polyphosphate kinase|nr:polyphosphate kinase 1 [Gemmatimonadaceae bacterium]